MHEFEVGDHVVLNAPDDMEEYAQYNGEPGVIERKAGAWGDWNVRFDRNFLRPEHRTHWINPHTAGWTLDKTWLIPARTPVTLRETW